MSKRKLSLPAWIFIGMIAGVLAAGEKGVMIGKAINSMTEVNLPQNFPHSCRLH